MKRVLLLGIILAICILAMPQGVSAANTAVVNANVKDVITFDVTNGQPGLWTLITGQQNLLSPGVTLAVTSNSRFDVNVGATNGGVLKSTGTGAETLANQIEIKDATDTWAFVPDTSAPLRIVKDHAKTTEAGVSIPKNIEQNVVWADQHLVGTDVYQITFTYTVVPTV